MLEICLYDAAKSMSENEDPIEAFLCFHPPLERKKNLMIKLQYLSMYRATKDFLSWKSNQGSEVATIKTSKKVIQIFEIIKGSGVLVLIEMHYYLSPQKKEPHHLEEMKVKDFQDLIQWTAANLLHEKNETLEEDVDHREYCAKESLRIAETMKDCFRTLLPTMSMSDTDVVKDIFYQLMNFGHLIHHNNTLQQDYHHDVLPLAIPQVVTHWFYFPQDGQIISCPNQNLLVSKSSLKWFALTKNLMKYPLSCCCQVQSSLSITLKPGVVIWPIKGSSITSGKCKCSFQNTSVATRVMHTLLKNGKSGDEGQTSSCLILYSQQLQASKCHLNLVLAQCYDLVDQELINTIWRTCLTKMASIERNGDSDMTSTSSSSSRRCRHRGRRTRKLS